MDIEKRLIIQREYRKECVEELFEDIQKMLKEYETGKYNEDYYIESLEFRKIELNKWFNKIKEHNVKIDTMENMLD